MFFWIKENVKTFKERSYLITQHLVTQLPEVGTGKSRSPTSNIPCSEVWTLKTMQLRTVCDKHTTTS